MVEAVPVRMDVVAMPVRVHVDQVRRLEQGRVREDLGHRRRCGDPMILGEHDATVGELVQSSEVVCGADDRLPRVVQLDDEVEEPALRTRVERRGRLVEQENVRVPSTEAIATRFFSPPESWYGARSASSAMSRSASTSSTRRSTSEQSNPRWRGPNDTSSRTVGEKSWASELWNTKPTRARNARANWSSSSVAAVSSVPNAWTVPRSGPRSPASNLSIVDLPQPFAPSRATRSPAPTVRETPASATKRSR
jgi:hypothetical protein